MGGSRLFQCLPSNLGIPLPRSKPNREALHFWRRSLLLRINTQGPETAARMSSASKSGRRSRRFDFGGQLHWRDQSQARTSTVPVIPELRDPYGREKSGARAKDSPPPQTPQRARPLHQGRASPPRFPCAPPSPAPQISIPPRASDSGSLPASEYTVSPCKLYVLLPFLSILLSKDSEIINKVLFYFILFTLSCELERARERVNIPVIGAPGNTSWV
jgi:hypothetical protein